MRRNLRNAQIQNRAEIRFVHSYLQSEPKLFLIEGISGAKPALKVLKPLVIYGENGEYTDEVKRLYKGENC